MVVAVSAIICIMASFHRKRIILSSITSDCEVSIRAYGLHGFVLILACLVAQSAAGDDLDWADTFYQYRVPVTLEADAAGWTMVPLTPAKITSAINQLETLQFDPQWFAANHVKVVEIDDAGRRAKKISDILESFGHYFVGMS